MSRYALTALLFVASLCPAATPETPPPLPPPVDYRVIDDFIPAGGIAGGALWKPMFGGTELPTPVRIADRSVLRFPCSFKSTRMERASWDREIKLDLSAARGLRFRFYSVDISPVSQFAVYLRSGDGWYGNEFDPDRTGAWTTVTVEKNHGWVEGTPAGWDQISAMRISAWRGGDVSTAFYIADFGVLGADARVILLRRGRAEIPRAARIVPRILDGLGLEYLLVDGASLTPQLLRSRALVIVPAGVEVSEDAAAQLKAFAASDGAVLALGSAPTNLPTGDRIRAAEQITDARSLVAAIQDPAPKLAEEIARLSIARIGAVGPYHRLDEAVQEIRKSSPPAGVLANLDTVLQLRTYATEASAAGEPDTAVLAAERARGMMLEAYCTVQRPAPGEHRAFWCHSAFGVDGMSWDEAIKNLADNGFTAILPNMLWGGVAYYKSDVLPVAPEVAEKGDQITACLAACRKYGVQCHVWKVNWNMSHRTPKEFLERVRSEGRTQVRFSGEKQDLWLCPSHPANQQLEIDAMVEIAAKYEVDGIHFDYIRYPDADACFCAACRQRFEKVLGKSVTDWPAELRRDRALVARWNEFRRGNITAVVSAVAEKVHKTRPGVKVSAAVFRHWVADRDGVAQDWKTWCDRGYLDFICPMDYTPSNHKFESLIRQQLEWAGKVPCYPGIGLSVWPDRTDVCKLIDQILITRRLKTGGFTVFNYAGPEAREVVPYCGKGITARSTSRPAS